MQNSRRDYVPAAVLICFRAVGPNSGLFAGEEAAQLTGARVEIGKT